MAFPGIALSSELDVPEHVWNSLSSSEQINLSQKFEIRTHATSSYGILVDSQVLDKSTAGTTSGANLGAAYAQARYIDNAFSGDSIDYSASKQIGAGVLGAVVGSLLDKPATSKFITRYTVHLANNNIQTFDETSKEQGFSKATGLCVLTNPVRPTNQHLCNLTKQELLLISSKGIIENEATLKTSQPSATAPSASLKVKCKIGNNAPILMDKNLCLSANGEIL